MNKLIGIITYDTPHLKTEQVLLNLLQVYQDFRIYALPFTPRVPRSPLFDHRPDQNQAVHPQKIAKQFNLEYIRCQSDKDIRNECKYFLVLGAGILSAECVHGRRIVNAHPGIIPAARGLDSFKWSIYNNLPLGVSLHYIDGKVDAGELISVIQTPIFLSDTLAQLARRHYEMEISILSNFMNYLDSPQFDCHLEAMDATRRMSKDTERDMINSFDEYKRGFS